MDPVHSLEEDLVIAESLESDLVNGAILSNKNKIIK